jgi:hypothetical protein
MSNLQSSKASSVKALQHLQDVCLKARSPLYLHQQLRWVWKPTLVRTIAVHHSSLDNLC